MDNREQFRCNIMTSGHRACQGCGEAIGARMVTDLIGKNMVIINATGCLQVFTTHNQQSAWQVPWIHSAFANAAAVASGVESALRIQGKDTLVVVQAGDGGTFDIGMQCLSGMMERSHNVLFICYDNEAYMNTGIQRSSSTPIAAKTTTSPTGIKSDGKRDLKKDLITIMAAHHIPYCATASIAYFPDLKNKVEKALSIKGPRFLHIHCPCPLGWGHEGDITIEVARLAVETGLFPLLEMEFGVITNVMHLQKTKPVKEYLALQGRFSHLFAEPNNEEIEHIQALADQNIHRYNLLQEQSHWNTEMASYVKRGGRGAYVPNREGGES